MPGHKQLHERAEAALDRCQETQEIDFNEAVSWEDLKWGIIKTAMGMANLRDGGLMIVGVSERGPEWDLVGISPALLATFEVDNIIDQVNAYASPHVDLDIVTMRHRNGKDFLVIQAKEFQETPIVCKKNGPDGQGIATGAVYIRPPGKPQTTKPVSAAQMHDLLELAAEKRARRILEVSRRLGMVGPDSAAVNFERELGGL